MLCGRFWSGHHDAVELPLRVQWGKALPVGASVVAW